MNWAFSLLGVSSDTDVAGVKKAYARLLRSTRPDEDADGFQRLHAAYQLVLAQVSSREAHAAPSGCDTPPPATAAAAVRVLDVHVALATDRMTTSSEAGSTPLTPIPSAKTTPLLNPQELLGRVIQQAVGSDDERAFSRWLSAQPELWSIGVKQQTGQLLLQRLFREPQPISSACLDALLQFFDLQQLTSGVNPVALTRLRQRQLALWYVLPENHRALARHLNLPTNRFPERKALQASLDLLRSPLRWQRVLWPAIRRYRTAMIARLIHGLCGGQFADLPAPIDQQHAAFWYRAAQLGQISWPRFALGSVRAAFLALLVMVGMLSMTALSSLAEGSELTWYASLGIATTMAAGILLVWLVYAAWMWLEHWQGQPEATKSNNAWFRRMLIPALCATCIVIDYVAQLPVLATCMIMPTFVLSLRRYSHRSPPKRRRQSTLRGASLPGVGFLLVVLANAAAHLHYKFFDDVPSLAIVATVTLCIWLADTWRHRIYLKRSTVN